MKSYLSFLLLLFTFQSLSAQTEQAPAANKTEEIKNEVIQQLFNTREKNDFLKASAHAKKLGLSKQVILEATFLYHIDLAESDEIINITGEFQQMAENFDPDTSKIFTSKDDWLSVIEYGLALKALNEKNEALFKKHIQEAFWLSPNKAAAFAPHINQLHTNHAMAKLQLDLERKIFQVTNSKTISIAKLLENKQALVLRFWSPWSQNAELDEPLTKKLSNLCSENQISFASILINKDPQGIQDTLEIIEEMGKDFTSYWLADEDTSALTKLLRVADLPTIVIISKEGKILYNGTLHQKELWDQLTQIAPKASTE